jgi:hypothetical protein
MPEPEPPPQPLQKETPKPKGKFFTPLVERAKSLVKGPQKVVEAAQVENMQAMLKAIERHGSLEAAQKAEPKLFATGGVLSILAGHPGKGPTSK